MTIAQVAALPEPGAILHLDDPTVIAGGGGAIAFHQLAASSGDIHFFTALGSDDAAHAVLRMIDATDATIHAARRDEPHTRDIVLITPGGERTIIVVGEPLHPRRSDPLPWEILATCDAAYFTGQDPATIVAARAARVLAVTARRSSALAASGVRADVIVGSTRDPRERSRLSDYPVAPGAVVMTEGALGGWIETRHGIERFEAAAPPSVVGSYGAGDSFAGALTWFLARGLPLRESCTRAAKYGAAVLRGVNPIASQVPLE